MPRLFIGAILFDIASAVEVVGCFNVRVGGNIVVEKERKVASCVCACLRACMRFGTLEAVHRSARDVAMG